MEKYTAIIFDIINSRLIGERYTAQKKLHCCIDFLNQAYEKDIAKKVVTVAGDEFQGLFRDLASAISFCRQLQMFIFPIQVRCGIGYGEVKYFDNLWPSVEIDGEAYYNAREAINLCETNKMYQIAIKGTRFDRYYNASFSQIYALKQIQTTNVAYVEMVLDFLSPIYSFSNYVSEIKITHFVEKLLDDTFLDLSYSSLPYFYRDYSRGKNVAFNSVAFMKYIKQTKNTFNGDFSFYVDSKFERGTVSKLAEIFNSSPQNISLMLKNGRVELIRNSWCSIIDSLRGEEYA